MPDQPHLERFKSDMPDIPGVSGHDLHHPKNDKSALKVMGGLLVVLVVALLGVRFFLKPRHLDPAAAPVPPQMEVPAAAADPNAALPHASATDPWIAGITEMAKPWSSKAFFFRDGLTGENIPALLIRLPTGTAAQTGGYWAFVMNAAYGNCKLEYVNDLAKLKDEYGFQSAKHPMVGNPCSHTLFDPLRLTNLPGNIWVRGAIAQGSDLRPPLGIEVKIRGKDVLAGRKE